MAAGISGQIMTGVTSSAPAWSATPTLGASGTLGTLAFGNASSGTVTLGTVSGALGSVTASLPANSGIIAELNYAQTWSAAQTFTDADFLLKGSSSGAMTLKAPAAASTYIITFPATTDTVAVLGTAQTFTAIQTVTQSDLHLLGSSTGYTVLNSGLGSSGNNTLTLPTTATDTLAALATAETWTAVQTFTNSDIRLLGSSTGYTTFTSGNAGASNYTWTVPAVTDTFVGLNTPDQTLAGGANVTAYSIGTVTSGTSTIDCGKSPLQYMVDGGAFTLAAPSNDGSCIIRILNNGSAGAITPSGFTVGSNTGDTPDTTNAHAFAWQIWRINGVSRYLISAYQ